MRWKKEDLAKYVQAKEYIDTVLMPLVPFQISDDKESEKNAFQMEVMKIFSNEIEQELSGRVMLIPNYVYVKTVDKENEIERLNQWIRELKIQPFNHFILLSFDASWKKHEKDLEGNLLWLPGMQSGDLNSEETRRIIKDQVVQLSEIIRSYWD